MRLPFKLAEDTEHEQVEVSGEDRINPGEIAKEVMEKHFGVKLGKRRLSIFGKYKEFDLVNVEEAIVGDVKCYTFKGEVPAAQFSAISEYIWLMEKLERSSKRKWRKIIVGLGNKEIFEKYVKNYNPWLGDIEIYFIDEEKNLEILRSPNLGL